MQRFMMLLLMFGGVFLCGSAWAAPLLVTENTVHDFGQILQGDQLEYTFRFQNGGDEVLDIKHLRSSCGCTAALLSAHRIAPGLVGELKIRFDSQGFRGQVQKMVTFDTNDPQHGSINFTLRGLVKVQLFIEPQSINWGRVSRSDQLTRVLRIVNESAQTVVFQPPQVTSADLQATLSRLSLPAGETAILEVTANFPDLKKRLAGYVILHSNFPSVPQLKVPVSARLLTQ
ncbi:MAG: DUF1573 domain-containing protein [Desulfuromonadales bacterium]|nr:DUF1573 domain-containing protein [Desulfuromonadales bacterium]MBN2792014.1 DUF1573 domain-containing protein [Desulfuromonadales bacterium]